MSVKIFFDLSRRLAIVAAVIAIIGSEKFASSQNSETWRQSLPQDVQASILWDADHEEGSLFDWEYDRNPDNNGGGIFTTGPDDEAISEVVKASPFSGAFCAKAMIAGALNSKNGERAVRLMRWTDKPWDQGGIFLPKSAYYGVWIRLDENYSVQNDANPSGGWWNVFQFKSNDKDGASQPVWVLNIGNDAKSGAMQFYLYSKHNQPSSVSQTRPLPIPVGRWFHLEAFYEQAGAGQGSITIWQDGQLILSANKVKTVLTGNASWGIGNYTDHITGGIKPGTAAIYFDDATISTKPTHPYTKEIAGQN